MKRSAIASILIAAVAACLLLLASPGAQASPDVPISINFTAEVWDVDDDFNHLGGAISVGDTITGSYTYDAATPDSNPDPTVGRYLYTSPPYGIRVDAGGFVFQTDPSNVDFEIEILNDRDSPARDYYVVTGRHGLPLSNGASVDSIQWQLDDPTATALSSDALPTVPPTLADWESLFGLWLLGEGSPYGFYTVSAHVTSVSLAPPPLLNVEVDIRPHICRNLINPRSRGTIPVAILSSPTFDAPGEVDKESLTFGATGDEDSLARCLRRPRDVNRDGLADLVCRFNNRDTGFQCGDTEGILRGQTVAGVPIEGRDSVRIVPCRWH
jgi:hypothetical protein